MSISRPRHFNEIKSEGGGITSNWTTTESDIYYDTGNVGIGTTAPATKLHVDGNIRAKLAHVGANSSWTPYACFSHKECNTATDYAILQSENGLTHINAANGQSLDFRINNGSKMCVGSNGFIGIGTTSPAYPLDVIQTHNNEATQAGTYNDMYVIEYHGHAYANQHYQGGLPAVTHEYMNEVGIMCNGGNIMAGRKVVIGGQGGTIVGGQGGYVIAYWGTLNSSDERIKYDIEDINDSSALEKLRELKPRTYKYKYDKGLRSGGRGTVYGFIAQEVKSVFPEAVRMLGTEHVPNIQEVGVYSSANKTITFTNFDTSGIPTSGVIRVVTAKNEAEYLDINYISIIDSHTIEVETDISEHCGAYDEENEEFIAGNNIYVEGCQVPDFHLLKKENIFTLATAALQEVDRQLQAEKAKTATLEAKTATLETTVADLVARITALENA